MKILIIEGLGNNPFIENQLIKPMLEKHPDAFEYESRAWNAAIDTKDQEFDVVIGHSLGGHTAMKHFYRWVPPYLITLDPRWISPLSCLDVLFRWQGRFQLPGVGPREAFNFTHSPNVFFPGYDVIGAENKSVRASHVSLPGHPEVFSCLERIVVG